MAAWPRRSALSLGSQHLRPAQPPWATDLSPNIYVVVVAQSVKFVAINFAFPLRQKTAVKMRWRDG